MSISSLPTGYSILEQSSKMADNAANQIQHIAKTDATANQQVLDPSAAVAAKQPTPSMIDPLVELTQAAQYNRVGASVIARDQEMIGSLLDIHI